MIAFFVLFTLRFYLLKPLENAIVIIDFSVECSTH